MADFVHHRTELPGWLASGIGCVAAEWSALEWELEETIRLLIPTHIQHGRIVSARAGMLARIMIATNLAQAYVLRKEMQVDLYEQFVEIGERIKNAEEDRNKIIHGLWGLAEDQWYLLWERQQRAVADFGKRSNGKAIKLRRAVLPQRELMTREKIKTIRSTIKACSAEMDSYRAKLEATLPPSPYTSPRQLKQTLRLHKKRGRKLPPKS